MSLSIYERIYRLGLIPTVKLPDASWAVSAAQAMLSGGVCAVEVIWDDSAAESIRKIAGDCPEMLTGAGELQSEEQCAQALDAGARFLLTDFLTESCVELCRERDCLLIPRCSSIGEVRAAQKAGLRLVNFLPQESSGGPEALRQLAAPFVDLKFLVSLGRCPDRAQDYLCAPFVFGVRGSWACPESSLRAKSWDAVTLACENAVTEVLGFQLFHIGINTENADVACGLCDRLHDAFRFTLRDNGPSSRFAGDGIEVMKRVYRGRNGHFAIRTNNVERAIAYLGTLGYEMDMDTAYYAGGRIYTVYLKEEHDFGGFAAHLLQKAY